MKKDDFSNVDIATMGYSNKSDCLYRVYKDKKEFVELEAESAHEAILKSEVEAPYKVERVLVENEDFVDSSQIEKRKKPMPANNGVQQEMPAEGEAEQQQATATEPANNDESVEPQADVSNG